MNVRALSKTLTLWLSLALAAQQPATLRIGTWNLEQLGIRGDPPRSEADHQAIADYIQKLEVAVLAVQEVGSDQALDDLCRRIGPTFANVLGTTGGFSDGKGRVSVGFVYDTSKVELLHAAELLQLPTRAEGLPIFHRIPVTACFRTRQGGLDFRAVSVHIKAGQKPDDFQKRRLEVSALHGWLATLLQTPGEDQDVVVLGDFNHSYETEAATVFQRDGLVRYLKSAKATDPTISHFDAPIDMFAVTRGFDEVVDASYDVHNEDGLRDKATWQRVYTDHFPLTLALAADRDRDPQATFTQEPQERRLPAKGRAHADGPQTVPVPAPASGTRAVDVLTTGSRVLVITTDARVSGTLLRPLGDWIWLRDQQGLVRAFPVAAVLEVRQGQQ